MVCLNKKFIKGFQISHAFPKSHEKHMFQSNNAKPLEFESGRSKDLSSFPRMKHQGYIM